MPVGKEYKEQGILQIYYNIMGPPSLTETSLCGAFLYSGRKVHHK